MRRWIIRNVAKDRDAQERQHRDHAIVDALSKQCLLSDVPASSFTVWALRQPIDIAGPSRGVLSGGEKTRAIFSDANFFGES
jgi:hypothetical protein